MVQQMDQHRLHEVGLSWMSTIQLSRWNWSSTHIHGSFSDSWARELHLGDRRFLEAFGSVHTIITDCRDRWHWIITGKCLPLELYPEVLTTFSRIPQIRRPTSPTVSNMLFILYMVIVQGCDVVFPHHLPPAHQSLLRPQLPGQVFCFPICPPPCSMGQASYWWSALVRGPIWPYLENLYINTYAT